ncbi:MAG: amidase, partial [Candidatus Puniceispirillaceae bacterium]
MPFYQSIADILSENRQDKRAVLSRTKQVIGALDGLGRELDATVFLDPEFSHNQATSVAKGDADLPLFGVPLAHKELYGRHTETAIWPDEGGSKSCKGQLAKKTATTIDKLDKAGAIDCGRLVSVEYALGVTGHNAYAGTPKNPWNRDYVCGGSSSGSAAVVAAGIVPGALGSDTGGSIRLPAAACGLVGIKPTQGLISRSGIFPLSASLDTAGPLTRSVEDGARILSCLTGYDSTDAMSIKTAKIDYTEQMEAGLNGIKIGLAGRYFLEGSDSDVADMIARLFDQLNQLGAAGSDVEIPGIENTNPLNVLLIASEASQVHGNRLKDIHSDLNAQTLMRI